METYLCEFREILGRNIPIQTEGALIVMPSTRESQARQAMNLAAARAGAQGLILVILDTERVGLIKIHNYVFKHSLSPWYGYIAQDAFAGRQWLSMALDTLEEKQAGLLAFNDGKWHGQIAAFGLARRSWAQAIYEGDLFFPGYRSHYGDTELSVIAREQGQYAYNPQSVLVEVDWDKDRSGVNADDRSLYKFRARQGFSGRVQNSRLLELFG